MTIRLACHVGIGPCVEGVALVADDNFSARYDLDRINGVFSRPQHSLYGQSYRDVILVLNTAKGGMAPKALLLNAANTILAQGAALADMAMCDRFAEGDVTRLIRTGDRLTVDPAAGLVTITGRASEES